jgi:uncharacterized coiled-coil protein SlyX
MAREDDMTHLTREELIAQGNAIVEQLFGKGVTQADLDKLADAARPFIDALVAQARNDERSALLERVEKVEKERDAAETERADAVQRYEAAEVRNNDLASRLADLERQVAEQDRFREGLNQEITNLGHRLQAATKVSQEYVDEAAQSTADATRLRAALEWMKVILTAPFVVGSYRERLLPIVTQALAGKEEK